jgi:hypothetical protein
MRWLPRRWRIRTILVVVAVVAVALGVWREVQQYERWQSALEDEGVLVGLAANTRATSRLTKELATSDSKNASNWLSRSRYYEIEADDLSKKATEAHARNRRLKPWWVRGD